MSQLVALALLLSLVPHVRGDFCGVLVVGLFVLGAYCLCGLFLFSQEHASLFCIGLIVCNIC